jgi:hypothetical protein
MNKIRYNQTLNRTLLSSRRLAARKNPGKCRMNDESKSNDLLGLKPVGIAIEVATRATFDGAGAFLSRICLPAAEELGFLLRDKVSAWRAANARKIVSEAEKKFHALPKNEDLHAHPRIVGAIIENGSWSDDDQILNYWAGLLASSCTPNGKAQENLIFVNLLSQITPSQARLLAYVCENAKLKKTHLGLLIADRFEPAMDEIVKITEQPDLHILDLEIDHLREIGVLDGNSSLNIYEVHPLLITPSAMGIQLYVRCQGYIGPPTEYFGL